MLLYLVQVTPTPYAGEGHKSETYSVPETLKS